MSIKQILYNVEVAPPPIIWDRVATALDNGFMDVREQLFYNTAVAPKMAWDRIATKLDNGNEAIASILNNLEVAAPAMAWSNIEKALDEKQNNLKVVYAKPKLLPNVLKAAAGLFLVVGLGYALVQFNSKPKQQTASKIKPEASQKEIAKTENTPIAIEPNIDLVKPAPIEKREVENNEVINPSVVPNNNDVATNTQAVKRQSHNLIIDVPNAAKLIVKKGMPITPDLTFVDAVGSQVIVTGPNGTNFNISSSLASKLYMSFNAGTRDEKELLDTRIEEAAIWRAKYEAWKLAFESKLLKSTSMLDFIEELATLKNP